MSAGSVPPAKPAQHLKIFVVSLALIVICLVALLFAVRLEATVPATGFISARDQQDVRAPLFGLVELGWYEASVTQADGSPLKVRVDDQGNGMTEPGRQTSQPVHRYKLPGGLEVLAGELKFHALKAGDELWPGQVIAWIRNDDMDMQEHRLKARLEDLESRGQPGREVIVELNILRDRLNQSIIRAPLTREPWLVLKTFASSRQAVKPGDPITLIAPLDPVTRQPKELLATLTIDEQHAAEIEPGQIVRLTSTMYNQRLHGHAEGTIERLEPLAEQGPGGERLFRAQAVVTHSPYPLRPGSSFKADILIGRKPVYRIILEQ